MGPADLFASLLLLAWLAWSWQFTGDDPDLFWHLKYGQLFLAARGFAVDDDFAWSVPHAPWLNHEWGGEVLLAWVFGLGGLAALQALRWAIFAGSLALALRILMRAGVPFAPAALGAVTMHVVLGGQETMRIQNVTVALMVVTAYVLQTWWLHRRLGAAGWAYPLLVVAWVNVHGGGAIAGAASCWVVLGAEAAACLRTGRWAELRPLAYLAIAGSLALCANPQGVHMPLFSLGTFFDPAARAANALIAEWHPPDWSSAHTRASALGLAAVVLAGLLSRTVPPMGMLAFAGAWAFLACGSRRNLVLASVASLPLAACWLADLRSRAPGFRRIAAGSLTAVAVAAMLASPHVRQRHYPLDFPLPSADALEAAIAVGQGRRLLNLYEWGGLLIYVGHPRLKVFVDGRAYPYGPAIIRDHGTLFDLRPGWQALLASYRIDMVVAPPAAHLVKQLAKTPGWRVAFTDATATILLKAPAGPE